jgi:hypothetical protein
MMVTGWPEARLQLGQLMISGLQGRPLIERAF